MLNQRSYLFTSMNSLDNETIGVGGGGGGGGGDYSYSRLDVYVRHFSN